MANTPINQKLPDHIISYLKSGPAESADIAMAIGEVKQSVISCLGAMARDRLVEVHAPGGKANVNRVYRLTSTASASPSTATTRTVVGRDTYTGPVWSHETARPGSAAHLQHPSRRGDVRVPHTGQIITAS
jgi:hypothetical protein